MRFPKSRVVLVVALFLALPSTYAWAHWCDDLWSSAYNIVVRPDSDTSPKQLYVENRWGYQFTNFKLTATSSSGGAITLTPPTTLKQANTLLPGEKGIWKITAGSPAKVEDLTFHVTFGNTSGSLSKQYACYPVLGASPVMVVKNNGDLFPSTIAGLPTGASDLPKPNTANGCTFGDVSLGRSLQEQTIADWEDLNVGLDNLMTLYCAGRGSWAGDDRTVAPNANCKNATSTSCPTSKPASATGSRGQYMRLWGAGALAIRKASLGTRLPVFRQRLQCGANDGDTGFAGYALFVLGYLGDDSGAKSFLQTQASASGDLGTIAKAALYVMGDTTQKSAVQAGVQSSSVFVKVACAAALGIVDKDDASVNSALIPQVKWNEPDDMGGDAGEDGKGMYAAHMLEIVAFDRRGWVYRGNADGPVTFYGETGGGAGGTSGSGGTSGTGGTPGSGAGGTSGSGGRSGTGAGGTSGSGGTSDTGGAVGSGGRSGSGGATVGSGGSPGSGGAPGVGGGMGNGGQGSGGAQTTGSGGASGSSGGNRAGGSSGNGGSTAGGQGTASGCEYGLGGQPDVPALFFPAVAGMALLLVRRRRRNR